MKIVFNMFCLGATEGLVVEGIMRKAPQGDRWERVAPRRVHHVGIMIGYQAAEVVGGGDVG